jgi:hypothetical protein
MSTEVPVAAPNGYARAMIMASGTGIDAGLHVYAFPDHVDNVRICREVDVLGLKNRPVQPTNRPPARIDRYAIGWSFSGRRVSWLQ